MLSAGVVADANVLLSAVIGKAAARVFFEFEIAVHATEFNALEVEEYIPRMAEKYRLPRELVELQWRLLPLKLHSAETYRDQIAWAERELAGRDPGDAHALALAVGLGLPIWSNDRDLEGYGVTTYSTAQ
ncbi:MAG TPA: PIN domain-containing protein, partial [Thermoanaerobaculia bacterium]|nr:PIN domain-containing protein [Thermoanaerobaculia bacterium]